MFDDIIIASHFSHNHSTILLLISNSQLWKDEAPQKFILHGKVIPGIWVCIQWFFTYVTFVVCFAALQNIGLQLALFQGLPTAHFWLLASNKNWMVGMPGNEAMLQQNCVFTSTFKVSSVQHTTDCLSHCSHTIPDTITTQSSWWASPWCNQCTHSSNSCSSHLCPSEWYCCVCQCIGWHCYW